MPGLTALLQMPDARLRENAWRTLVTGDTYFLELQKAIRLGTISLRNIEDVKSLLDRWKEFHQDKNKNERGQYQWNQLSILLKIAYFVCIVMPLRNASLSRDVYNNIHISLLDAIAEEIGVQCDHPSDHGTLRTVLAIANDENKTASPSGEDPAVRGMDCVCTFLAEKASSLDEKPLALSPMIVLSQVWETMRDLLGAPRPIEWHCEIAVAGAAGNRGFLATLQLETVAPGYGAVFQAPRDALHTRADASFAAAMRDAWRGVNQFLTPEGRETRTLDGRWRLLRNNTHAAQANDRSASGAAARGWYSTLTQTFPDEGVIVIAQVDENDVMRLTGVDDPGVFAKTLEVAEKGNVNTIVVASKGNESQAKSALKDSQKLDSIRVLNLAKSNV